jgi:hypothetical protein
MAAVVWIAAGAVSADGVSALAVATFWNRKAQEREQGESHEQQSAEQ